MEWCGTLRVLQLVQGGAIPLEIAMLNAMKPQVL